MPLPDLPSIPLPWHTQTAPQADGANSLSVLVWDEGPATETLRQLLVEFEAEEPDLDINLVVSTAYEADLDRMIEAGDPPDLLLVDSFHFPEWAAEGRLADPQNQLDSADDFYPDLVEAFRHNQTVYCLPREVRTLALVYDKAAFAQANLQPPTSWEELRQRAEILTDPNTSSFGLIVSPDLSRWLPFLYQAGGHGFNSDRVAMDTLQAETALNFYITIFRDNFAGQPAESNSSWAGEVLGKGKGSMAVEGNWIVPYLEAEFPEFEAGIAPLPAGPGGRGTVAFTSCYAVMAQSTRQEQAFALANFLTGREAMQRWSTDGAFMPTRISLRTAWLADFPDLAPFMDGIDEAIVWQFPAGFDAFPRTFNRSMLELFAADIEALELLARMQRVGELLQR